MCGIFFLIKFLKTNEIQNKIRSDLILKLENELHQTYYQAPTILVPQILPGFEKISQLKISYPEAILRLILRGPSSLNNYKINYEAMGVEIQAVSSVLKMRNSNQDGSLLWDQPLNLKIDYLDCNLTKQVILCYNGELYSLDEETWT